MIRKTFITLVILGMSTSQMRADAFNPSVSLLGTYTATRNYSDIIDGIFSVKNRRVNFGVEFSNKFIFNNKFFIQSGIRYNQYRTRINMENQISALQNYPYPNTWVKGFESVAIPVLIGKQFYTNEGRKISVFAGGSFGVLMTSLIGTRFSQAFRKDADNDDLIGFSSVDSSSNRLPAYTYYTFDIGADYHPFKAERWSVGVLFSLQLNKTDPYTYTAVMQNYTTKEHYYYEIRHSQQVANFSFKLAYHFGKTKHRHIERYQSLKCAF